MQQIVLYGTRNPEAHQGRDRPESNVRKVV